MLLSQIAGFVPRVFGASILLLVAAVVGDGPLVAAAIHDDHEVRSDIAPLLAVPEDQR